MDAAAAIAGMIAVCLTALVFLFCLMILPQMAERGNKIKVYLVWGVVATITSWVIWATLSFFNRQILVFRELTGRNPNPVEFFKYGASESGLEMLKREVAKRGGTFAVRAQQEEAEAAMRKQKAEQAAAAQKVKKGEDPNAPKGPKVRWRKEDFEAPK